MFTFDYGEDEVCFRSFAVESSEESRERMRIESETGLVEGLDLQSEPQLKLVFLILSVFSKAIQYPSFESWTDGMRPATEERYQEILAYSKILRKTLGTVGTNELRSIFDDGEEQNA